MGSPPRRSRLQRTRCCRHSGRCCCHSGEGRNPAHSLLPSFRRRPESSALAVAVIPAKAGIQRTRCCRHSGGCCSHSGEGRNPAHSLLQSFRRRPESSALVVRSCCSLRPRQLWRDSLSLVAWLAHRQPWIATPSIVRLASAGFIAVSLQSVGKHPSSSADSYVGFILS
jgi:hypothetical protein